MARYFFVLVVILQEMFRWMIYVIALIQCQDIQTDVSSEEVQEPQVIDDVENVGEAAVRSNAETFDSNESNQAEKDMFAFFFGGPFVPMQATEMISKVASSDCDDEKKIKEIKSAIDTITASTKAELYTLIESAMCVAKKGETNGERKKRSTAETPIDSAKLITRLLNHIKSNNEHQNIAIEKMMTAQEIADKYGIQFSPDPEIILDLATATSEQADQLKKFVSDHENVFDNSLEGNTLQFIPYHDVNTQESLNIAKNPAYYQYQIHQDSISNTSTSNDCTVSPISETILSSNQETFEQENNENTTPQPKVPTEKESDIPEYYYFHPMFESQMMTPPVQHPPVTPNHNVFHDIVTPHPEVYIQFTPVMEETITYMVPPEIQEPEPELVGEEYEETISSKVFVEHGEEPGSASLNHITTYTMAEKSHFKAPEMPSLPQQMQYYFYMI